MRNIIDVINKIETEIPENQYLELRKTLDWIKKDCAYKAPELMTESWQYLTNALNKHLGEPTEKWKERIQLIFADKI